MAIERPMTPLSMPQQPPAPPPELPPGEVTVTDDGGAVVQFGEDPKPQPEFADNLADFMDDGDLTELSTELIRDYESDKESRSEWEKTYIKGLNLLGLTFEERSIPWDGACGVFHPMLTESVVRFQAQTIQEIFPATGPAKSTVVGEETPERLKQGQRVEEYLNHLLTKQMPEYRTETERLLFSLPIAGSAFRKCYFDPNLGRPASMFVPAEDFVVSYGASDLSTCPRATHVMKQTSNEVRKAQVKGFYRDVELTEPTPEKGDIKEAYDDLTGDTDSLTTPSRHTLLEMQVEVDLKGFEDEQNGEATGIALPYVVTIDKSSQQILGIRRNWLENDPLKLKRDHVVHYQYLPGLGFYGFGLVHMIGGLSKSATSLLRQLIDSGTLANLPGGLKTRGFAIKGDDSPIMPGEFRDVDVPGGTISENITFLPYKEPSGVLYQLLGDLVQEGRRFASAADIKAADMNGEAPVGTTLALLEREMKVLSAVQARVHQAMGRELVILSGIVRDKGPERYPYDEKEEHSLKEDFDDRVDVIPVSDPNAGTMAQRIMQFQAALQLAQQAPQFYDMALLHRQMLHVLGIREADKIIPTDDDMLPHDPITENMAILTGKPVKAFLYQDHEAHLQAHMAAAEHPKLQEMMEKNPQAQVVTASMAAHVADHLAMAYRDQVEKEAGVPLPGPEEPMPEDIELRLSRLVGPAAAQLTGKAQRQKQAEENAKQQEDPIIQMKKQELDIKQSAQTAKAYEAYGKIMADMEKFMQRLRLERDQMEQAGALGAANVATKLIEIKTKVDTEQAKIDSSDQAEGFRLGSEMVLKMIESQQEQPSE